ncbi:MAG: DMT family transporter [Rhodobacteraceae bacterium]|nr:DMT family transporter [Paracoccaceae bacterium]
MRLFWLTLFAMMAFAANSVLTRYALAFDQISPGGFVAVRLMSGAVTLALIVAVRPGKLAGQGSLVSAAALLLYAGAFSYAYVSLDAGVGALILFGGVQITMFAGALWAGERPKPSRWLGMVAGMAGLAVLFAPKGGAPDLFGAVLMAFSALGWGVYSLRGKSVALPLQATAVNFLIAAPFAVLLWLVFPAGPEFTTVGVALAIASGALASGVGYAVWYAVLPKLDASLAAIVQLTVPVIALTGGILFLDETATLTFVIASALILGGIAVAVLAKP